MIIDQLADDVVRIHGAFTPAECERLMAMFDPNEKAPCLVYRVLGSTAPAYEDRNARDVDVSVLRGQPEAKWIHEKMGALFMEANARIPGCDPQRIIEPIKIMRYGTGQHFRQWHADKGEPVTGDPHWRELTMSVELSRPEDYEGGSLIFAPQIETNYQKAPRGAATIFDARKQHCAKPVKSGARWVLMNWISNKPLPCESFYEVRRAS